MGNSLTKVDPSSTETISDASNDYNPFNIPSIPLGDPSKMNGEIAFAGCPPGVNMTKGEFSRLPTGKQAAFADGVVRGSYEQDWLIRQNNVTLPDSTLKKMDSSSVGALAYVYLKTGNRISLKNLERWVEIHRDDNTIFD